MTRQEIITHFQTTYGYVPDEDELREIMGDAYTDPHIHQHYQRQSYAPSQYSAEGDLLSEVRNIFTGIAKSAKQSVHIKAPEGSSKEFQFMFLIFLCKTGLYFLLKSSTQEGYNFSNM